MAETLLHASCVAYDGRAVLLTGPSGCGKSDLALRLIEGGCELVADDQVCLCREGQAVFAFCPPQIAGLIEARHVGLLRMPYLQKAEIALYVELVDGAQPLERLPAPAVHSLLDRPVRWLKLRAWEASAPAKIKGVLMERLQDVE